MDNWWVCVYIYIHIGRPFETINANHWLHLHNIYMYKQPQFSISCSMFFSVEFSINVHFKLGT